jgi:hypothetical protein
MRDLNPCSAYSSNSHICKHGFNQLHPVCSGMPIGCPTCRQIGDLALPQCMRDEIPEHVLHRVRKIIQPEAHNADGIE